MIDFCRRNSAWVIALVLGVVLTSCEKQAPFAPGAESGAQTITALSKGKAKSGNAYGRVRKMEAAANYPQAASMTLTYIDSLGVYEGGTIRIPNGSMFHVYQGSLTPPNGLGNKKPVTVTMLAEKGQGADELIFTFGPSGSSFYPPAEIWMSWSEMGVNSAPELFYIDADGNYIAQKPDAVDRKGKRFLLKVYHFSRYAVAHSQ